MDTRLSLTARRAALSEVLDDLKTNLGRDMDATDKDLLVSAHVVTKKAVMTLTKAEMRAVGLSPSTRDKLLALTDRKSGWSAGLVRELWNLSSVWKQFEKLSWSNKMGLLAILAYTIFIMIREDTLGAYEVDQLGTKKRLKGFKIEKLVEQGNLAPLFTSTKVLIGTIYLDKRFKGAFVPLALCTLLVALVWWPLKKVLRKCHCIS